ncbi:hypothetical protein C8Q74DRAFT_532950 [Fomes fomentarius]|nr:hypothetical protein C8Q74DRAFT_532950 [Fomes fomentarius]
MSFNARLGTSNNFRRRRPFDRPHRAPHRQLGLVPEDVQPNETLNRPSAARPPMIGSSAPFPRKVWKNASRSGRPIGDTFPASSLTSAEEARAISGNSNWNDLRPEASDQLRSVARGQPYPSRPSSYAVARHAPISGDKHEHMETSTTSIVDPDRVDLPHTERPPARTGKGDRDARRRRPKSGDRHTALLKSVNQGPSPANGTPPSSDPSGSVLGLSLDPIAGPSMSHTSASGLLLKDLSITGISSGFNTSAQCLKLHKPMPLSQAVSSQVGNTPAAVQNDSRGLPRRSAAAISPPDVRPIEVKQEHVDPPLIMQVVKRERSPSPLLDIVPYLVTEGCVRIAPLPADCQKSSSNHKAARQRLAANEMKKLRALGLKTARVFTRDDGMVIDWKSDTPVMSDTLRPPVSEIVGSRGIDAHPEIPRRQKKQKLAVSGDEEAHDGVSRPADGCMSYRPFTPPELAVDAYSTHLTHLSQPPTAPARPGLPIAEREAWVPSNIIDLTERVEESREVPRVDVPARISLPPLARRTQPAVATHEPNVVSGPTAPTVVPSPAESPPQSGSCAPSCCPIAATPVSVTTRTLSQTSDQTDADEAEAQALAFLERYMLAFAEDRASLARAYSRAATLSIQTFPANSESDPPSSRPPQPHRGRADIVAALLALPEEHSLYDEGGEGAAEVDWEIVLQGSGDILLICYATVEVDRTSQRNGKGEGHARRVPETWAYEQRFVLKRRDWDEEDRNTPGLWSLVAVSHQMAIRRLA